MSFKFYQTDQTEKKFKSIKIFNSIHIPVRLLRVEGLIIPKVYLNFLLSIEVIIPLVKISQSCVSSIRGINKVN